MDGAGEMFFHLNTSKVRLQKCYFLNVGVFQ
ncbi:unknown [[Mannheimia] succiniciproducens MBEL55E]|uniref:Uncharacterized protein n=1 Tax=Mannheimia succiniciproducens (strain KCTC 0769BP / MBEL55E) TaxID=221988 RepID=Q65Q62_MANSM|nr:unknown [[Mannheimia] succiniciproducens MBEL55E]